ncbi:MAG TPA: hypothetical protein VI039_06530 [Solirubrobacterales bacterium]
MLFPQPRKRAVPQLQESPVDLSTPEKVQRFIEANVALSVEAKRKQEENAAEAGRIANDRGRFELKRDKLYLVLGLALIGLLLIVAAVLWFIGSETAALYLLGSGGLGSVVAFLLFRAPQKEE